MIDGGHVTYPTVIRVLNEIFGINWVKINHTEVLPYYAMLSWGWAAKSLQIFFLHVYFGLGIYQLVEIMLKNEKNKPKSLDSLNP